MNKKVLIPVISGIVITIIIAVFMIPTSEEAESETLSISYTETNKELQSILATQHITILYQLLLLLI